MEAKAERIGDAQLTSINVNAATPDVLNRICTEICDKVMEQIPDETVEKIATEVIEKRQIVYRRKSPYGSNDTVAYDLQDMVKQSLQERLKTTVEKIVDAFWKTEAVRDMVLKQSADTYAECLKMLPQVLAENFFAKISGTVHGNTHAVLQAVCDKACQNSMDIGVLATDLVNQTNLQLSELHGQNHWIPIIDPLPETSA